MIDPTQEELMSLRAAAKLPELRRDGRGPHIATLWRWVSAGRLETLRIGGGARATSREAVRRMLAAQNPGALPVVSPRERQRQVRDAEARLAAAGV